jgi:carboxypeptidase Taq
MKNAYQILSNIFREIGILRSISTLAQWDNDVTMPKGSHKLKQDQMMFLSDQIYQRLHSTKVNDLIHQAENENLNDWQADNLHQMKKQYLNNQALDQDLLSAITKATLECELNWREARANNDFKLFAKYFAPVLKLTQEISQRKAEMFKLSAYDALLDSYDPGRKSTEIDNIFADLEQFLPDFISHVKEKQSHQKIIPLSVNFPAEKQKNIGITCIKALGFDLEKGRLDTSTHPFSCSLSPDDVRITTRYEENNFLSGIFAILHETGHGIYNQNLPQDFIFQPAGEACGMTIHESQSLFIERHIGVTKGLFNWLAPYIAKEFGQDKSTQPENLYKLATQVGSSIIRVDADEVTYPAHILMRYKLEKAMLIGDLPIDDLPQAWDAESYRLLGKRPNNYQDGCLQDIHWAWGAFGYFPTYTLGAMFAAQINNYLNKIMDVDKLIQYGDFKPMIAWLNDNIHAYGSKYSADELIIKSTGSKLDANIFKQYLIAKYLGE